MNTASLAPGDPVKVNVRGQVFVAHIRAFLPGGLVGIDPIDSKRITYRQVGPQRIVEKVETQERLQVSA